MSSTTKPLKNAGRVAFRREGDYVNAYFADNDTLEGAQLAASFHTAVLDRTDGAFEAWQVILQKAYSQFLSDTYGVPIDEIVYKVEPGPEHERSGRA